MTTAVSGPWTIHVLHGGMTDDRQVPKCTKAPVGSPSAVDVVRKRVLSAPRSPWMQRRIIPWGDHCWPSRAAYPRAPERPSSTFAFAPRTRLCGLAPDGVCLAVPVTVDAVGFTAVSPFGRRALTREREPAVYLCCTFSAFPPPAVSRHRALCGARTFLPFHRFRWRPAIACTASTEQSMGSHRRLRKGQRGHERARRRGRTGPHRRTRRASRRCRAGTAPRVGVIAPARARARRGARRPARPAP